jgi:hypothetical protein
LICEKNIRHSVFDKKIENDTREREFGTVYFCLKAWQVIMLECIIRDDACIERSQCSLKMFYTTKEIIGNCPKMNRLENLLETLFRIWGLIGE